MRQISGTWEKGFWKVTIKEGILYVSYEDLLARNPWSAPLDEVLDLSPEEVIERIQETNFDLPPEEEKETWEELRRLIAEIWSKIKT